MIYLKVSPNKTIQYASASPEAGFVPYDGVMPDFPLLDDGSTAGWVGYRLVDGQLTFDQAVWDSWVQTNKSPEPVALLADDGSINADIRQIATSDTAELTLLNGWVNADSKVPALNWSVGKAGYVFADIKNPAEVAGWSHMPFQLVYLGPALMYVNIKDFDGNPYGICIQGRNVNVEKTIPANTRLLINFAYPRG